VKVFFPAHRRTRWALPRSLVIYEETSVSMLFCLGLPQRVIFGGAPSFTRPGEGEWKGK
jgi:hypothetical protein